MVFNIFLSDVSLTTRIYELYNTIIPEVGDFGLPSIIVGVVSRCVPYVLLWWGARKALSVAMNFVQGGDIYI